MKNYLIFRLYGAMSAWGDIAVGDIRPSYSYPSKSAVIGLIAASMGIERDEHDKQTELAKLHFSVRIDAAGMPVEDYHTIQTPSDQVIKNDREKGFWTRIDEVEAIKWRIQKTGNSKEGGAIQSRRTYLCDAIFTVALAEDKSNPVNWNILEIGSLSDIAGKLLEPEFVTYLGRKSCPLSLPMEPQIKSALNFKEAFGQSEFSIYEELNVILNEKDLTRYYSEEYIDNSQMKLTRRDQPVNRLTWQFTDRDEYYFCE